MKDIAKFFGRKLKKFSLLALDIAPNTVYVFPETSVIPKFFYGNVEKLFNGEKFYAENNAPQDNDTVVKCANIFDAVAKMMKANKIKVPAELTKAAKVQNSLELTPDQRKLLGVFIPFMGRPKPTEQPTVVQVDDSVPPVEKLPAKKVKVVTKMAKSKAGVKTPAEKIVVTSEGIDPEDAM